jgi:hypothetical protein
MANDIFDYDAPKGSSVDFGQALLSNVRSRRDKKAKDMDRFSKKILGLDILSRGVKWGLENKIQEFNERNQPMLSNFNSLYNSLGGWQEFNKKVKEQGLTDEEALKRYMFDTTVNSYLPGKTEFKGANFRSLYDGIDEKIETYIKDNPSYVQNFNALRRQASQTQSFQNEEEYINKIQDLAGLKKTPSDVIFGGISKIFRKDTPESMQQQDLTAKEKLLKSKLGKNVAIFETFLNENRDSFASFRGIIDEFTEQNKENIVFEIKNIEKGKKQVITTDGLVEVSTIETLVTTPDAPFGKLITTTDKDSATPIKIEINEPTDSDRENAISEIVNQINTFDFSAEKKAERKFLRKLIIDTDDPIKSSQNRVIANAYYYTKENLKTDPKYLTIINAIPEEDIERFVQNITFRHIVEQRRLEVTAISPKITQNQLLKYIEQINFEFTDNQESINLIANGIENSTSDKEVVDVVISEQNKAIINDLDGDSKEEYLRDTLVNVESKVASEEYVDLVKGELETVMYGGRKMTIDPDQTYGTPLSLRKLYQDAKTKMAMTKIQRHVTGRAKSFSGYRDSLAILRKNVPDLEDKTEEEILLYVNNILGS